MARFAGLAVFAFVMGCGPSPLVGSWFSQNATGTATLEVEPAGGVIRLNQYWRSPYATHPNCVVQNYRAGTYAEGGGGELTVTVSSTMTMDIGCPTRTWRLGSPQYDETWRYAMDGAAMTLTANGSPVGRFARR